jgi:hypothetical protein
LNGWSFKSSTVIISRNSVLGYNPRQCFYSFKELALDNSV